MNSKLEKLAQAGKASGKKAASSAKKAYHWAKDPKTHEQARKAAEAANKVYRVATSPEAKRVYAQAAEVIRKVRKK